MKLCILIGFCYNNSQNRQYMPGSLIDLFTAFNFCKNMYPDKILIITDINKKEKRKILSKHNTDETYEFLKDDEDKEQSLYIQSKYDFVSLDFFSEFRNLAENVFVYFSGHSNKNQIIFPNDSMLDEDTFSNIFNNLLTKDGQLFGIMDCCHSIKLNNHYIDTREVLCISSTLPGEKSISSKNGSPFTLSIFTSLSQGITDLNKLVTNVTDSCKICKQTATIFKSKEIYKNVWPWVFCKNFKNYKTQDHAILLTSINNNLYPCLV